MSFIKRLLTSSLRRQVDACVQSAGKIVALRLLKKYSSDYSEAEAMSLTVAVTNELFGVPPGNESAKSYLATNRDRVREHLMRLSEDSEICQIMSILALTKLNINGGSGTMTGEMLAWAAKLREIGVLLPSTGIELPQSPEALIAAVGAFERRTLGLPEV